MTVHWLYSHRVTLMCGGHDSTLAVQSQGDINVLEAMTVHTGCTAQQAQLVE